MQTPPSKPPEWLANLNAEETHPVPPVAPLIVPETPQLVTPNIITPDEDRESPTPAEVMGYTDSHLPPEVALASFIAECYADPLLFTLVMYPWNKAGTHLKGRTAPDAWQRALLVELGEEIHQRRFTGVEPVNAIQFSVASGHGIGKTALMAMLNNWLLSTRPFCRITLTSNTMQQLKARTWAEINKWLAIMLNRHWWVITSGQHMAMYHKDYPQVWRADAVPAVAEKSEAFAGQHNAASTSAYLFDEASNIPDKIYEVREGGLTDGEPITIDFGNPTRNSGRFYENMAGRFKHRYIRKNIDSRQAHLPNKDFIERLRNDYGEDSDYFRVRVLGEFPRSGTLQFIPTNDVERCMYETAIHTTPYDPVVMSVDVARFGDDSSVIVTRHGRNVRDLSTLQLNLDTNERIAPIQVFNKIDLMELANRIAYTANIVKPDQLYIDGTGMGAGVVDRLRQLNHEPIEINGAESPINSNAYANMRANYWGNLRDALKQGLALPAPQEVVVGEEWEEDIASRLKSELIGIEYGMNRKNKIQLEEKTDLKARLGRSTDIGDALGMSFAMPFLPPTNKRRFNAHTQAGHEHNSHQTDYGDPHSEDKLND